MCLTRRHLDNQKSDLTFKIKAGWKRSAFLFGKKEFLKFFLKRLVYLKIKYLLCQVVVKQNTKAQMKIKAQVLKKISASTGIQGRLCAELNKSYPTIRKWVSENDEGLTMATALKIIGEELGLTFEQILEETSKVA